MQFKDLIGQDEVKHKLVELVQHNRLSHALLFIGKEGNGTLPLSLAFAQYVVCETVNGKARHSAESSLFGDADSDQPMPILADACGICAACTKVQQLVHPDLHFSYPVVSKKAGSPPISTDYIAEWREFVRMYPYGNVYFNYRRR